MRTFSYGHYCMFAIVLATVMILALGAPPVSSAQVSIGVSVGFAPPDLPVYEQPLCPGDGYIWTPGYWAWDEDAGDYYWVPGTWVLAPEVGFFWTPGYWGWGGSGFVFYEGYWGPVVGFYGGINYGFGYFGHGYEGGRWQDGHFFYNQEVNNVNVTVIHNVYRTTINERNVTRVSYNGHGGVEARPTPEEERAAHERHIPPVENQRQHAQGARSNPELRASANHGKPPVAATQRPGEFRGNGVVQAREGGEVHGGPRNAGGGGGGNPGRGNVVHPSDIPRPERPGPVNSGNAKADRNYQKEQNKLYAQQEKDNQKLQRQQDKEHQQFAKRGGDDSGRQQMEQRHQQQTQQLQDRHTQQRQQLETRRPEPPKH